jgi:hypothetical protein
MATETIYFLVGEPGKAGVAPLLWQPSAALKFGPQNIMPQGASELTAMERGLTQNVRVEGLRTDEAAPRELEKLVRRSTVSGLIACYRAEKLPTVAATTRSTYEAALGRIERWAGDVPAVAITRSSVRVFRDAMLEEASHHVAHATLKLLRALFQWAFNRDLVPSNPATAFDLGAPPPRDQIWEANDTAAFAAAAVQIGLPGLAFAVELAEYIGQREADMIRLEWHPEPTKSNWREVKNLDHRDHDRLAGPDGRVMGFFVRQGKTKRHVGVPVSGAMRNRVEAVIAANKARDLGVATILVNDYSGRSWQRRHFIRKFVEAKQLAVAGFTAVDGTRQAPHSALAELQYRDLRRTAVVRMGELGLEDQLISSITGHQLETTKRILETYMPRTTKMAGRAMVARIGVASSEVTF